MRKLLLTTCLIFGSVSLFAATPSEFYLDLLRRGVAEVEGGRPQNATTLLRLAAFGLVESIEHYETAHVHLAVAADRLGDAESARDATSRVVAAEKVERRYASLQLAAPVRASFDTVAKKTLSATDLAVLTAKPAAEATNAPQAIATPQKPAAATTRPSGPSPKPAATGTTVAAASTPARPAASQPTQSVNSTPSPNAAQSSAAKPPASAQKPVVAPVDTKPVTTTVKPAETKPVTTASKPVETKPVATTTPKPVETKPVATASKPVETKPVATTTKPVETKPVATASKPVETKPVATTTPKPVETKPVATTTKPVETKPVATASKPVETKPVATTTNPPAVAAADVVAQLAAGDRALAAANLAEARRIYRTLLPLQNLDRRTLIRLAEGLYRSRDFSAALQAFRRLGTLRNGEEPYHYYVAVAMYETGDYPGAKRELAAALPHIQVTPDVQRYRAKIEGTR